MSELGWRIVIKISFGTERAMSLERLSGMKYVYMRFDLKRKR